MMPLGPAEVAHGPMFLGFMFNAILYGVMILQVHLYFSNPTKDPLWMRIFVLCIFCLDTMNTVFDFVYLYQSLIIHFNDPPYLQNATWVFATDPALTALIAALVQFFFAWRVKVLTNNDPYLYLVVVACATAGLLGGIATTAYAFIVPAFVKFQIFKPFVVVWLACECVGDIAVTLILCLHLRRRKTGFSQTDLLVDRIIRLTVHTGLITSICATVDLVLYLANSTGLHLIFNFPLAKLYTNSFIGSLNHRSGWGYSKEHGGSVSDGSDSTEDSRAACLPKPVPPPRPPQAALMDMNDEESLMEPEHDYISRPSLIKHESEDSESTAISVSSAPRKNSAISTEKR
ncbi:hypothetical protein C8F04DRAFT_1128656 [Mycena alexandri]|uniref:DUF6534 domain-containing protein n=1 Tax=Mycena alexandri TaxID=1745969 RepID=A0AAD6SCJ2_9AGAR|nr:hypothetical protein C8F04DRAFT_1128656 [Mycena alexandri]